MFKSIDNTEKRGIQMKNFDKTIQMYIFEGNPNGRIMCELSNWNGRVYKISRGDISEFAQREDADNTGLYFLFGKSTDGNDTIYIGEAERIVTRIKQHLKDKEYWNDCIAVISKDNLLNKAHVKFLENKFYQLAKDANRTDVINSTIPTCPSISEYDVAMLDEFIENARLLVNTLGYKSFDVLTANAEDGLNDEKEIFHIKAARGAEALGFVTSDGFAVLRSSKIATSTTPSMSEYLIKLRNKLIESGTVVSETFVKDYVFTSPSLAAAIVMGRNANGRTEWRNKDGITLKDIEESEIDNI